MLQQRLKLLAGNSVQISADPGASAGSIEIDFSEGVWLTAVYWRLIKDNKHALSSFDHLQQYGLPERIDAIAELQGDVNGKVLREARFDASTGDVVLEFTEPLILQILKFGGQEVWEINFPDGWSQWSNYV